jgi:hypothetical protein
VRVLSLTSVNKSEEFAERYNVNAKQEVSSRLDAFWGWKEGGSKRVRPWNIVAIRIVELWVIWLACSTGQEGQ